MGNCDHKVLALLTLKLAIVCHKNIKYSKSPIDKFNLLANMHILTQF